jgi:hypothetical protein
MNRNIASRAARALALTCALALSACGKSMPPPDPLQGARTTIDKAKNVDKVVGGAAAETRKEIDDQLSK